MFDPYGPDYFPFSLNSPLLSPLPPLSPRAASTSPMSPFFKDTVAGLLQCAQRHANYENAKVQISAFEAINDLVRSASRDTLDIVAQLIQVRTEEGIE